MVTKKIVLKSIDGKVIDIDAIVEKLKAKGFEILKKGEDYIVVTFDNALKNFEGNVEAEIAKFEEKIKKEIEKIRGVTVGEIVDDTVSFVKKVYNFIKDKAIPFIKKAVIAVIDFFKKLFTKK